MLFHYELNERLSNLSTLYSKDRYYLGTEGKLIKCDDINFDRVYKINNRELAYEILEKLNNKIKNVYNDNINIFTLEFEVVNVLKEIFNEENMFEIMKKADDRKPNILVIDGDGSPKIINDIFEAPSYPVRHELWEPYNKYVGKYADEQYFKHVYYSMFKGWSIYLKNRRSVFVDFEADFIDIEKSLRKID